MIQFHKRLLLFWKIVYAKWYASEISKEFQKKNQLKSNLNLKLGPIDEFSMSTKIAEEKVSKLVHKNRCLVYAIKIIWQKLMKYIWVLLLKTVENAMPA